MYLTETLHRFSLWGSSCPLQLSSISFRSCRSLLGSQIRCRRLVDASSCRTLYVRSTHGLHVTSSSTQDPGAWEYSPEWMGSQGGGWGRDEGTTVFSQVSHCGNGLVTVTSHAASQMELPPPGSSLSSTQGGVLQDWRTLRFNGVTRQSVAKVWRPAYGGSDTLAQADCLGMEYLKTMASAGKAGHHHLATRARAFMTVPAAVQQRSACACQESCMLRRYATLNHSLF